jgi:fermentation-respiration switch protein FrsA (DUF1100 family)
MQFSSENTGIVGDLFLPAHHSKGKKLPGVLVVGPWLNVKEQVATNGPTGRFFQDGEEISWMNG